MRSAGILTLALLAAPAAAAPIYKCVDQRGVTSYVDMPCADGKGAPVNIHGSPPASGKLQPLEDDLKHRDMEFRRRLIVREREAEKDRAELLRRCPGLREDHEALVTIARLVQVDAKGGRSVLDDQARAQRLAEVRQQLRSCP